MTEDRDGITDEPGRTSERPGDPPRRQEGSTVDNPFRLPSGLDATFGNTRTGVMLAFAVLCPPVAVVLGLIGLFACHDETARRKALWMTLLAAPLAAGFAYLTVGRP